MAETAQGGTAGPDAFVTSRTFDAPRERVWRAFTEGERLRRWWGPKGFTVAHCGIDPRPGGLFHYRLVSPQGQELWGKFTYREVEAPERLVAIIAFSDARAGITRHPWSGTWPLETLSTITFAESGGRTTVTVAAAPHEAAEEERATFRAGHDSMRQGWGGTFDRLAAYLAAPETPSAQSPCPPAEPRREHEWLRRLVGAWTFEAEASMGPGQPPMKASGSESVRPLGDLWVLAEGRGEMPGGGVMGSVMTLGYDPGRGRFVGTFVASVMTHLWVYEGSLDAAERVLTLDTEGPDMATGRMTRYQDIITIEDAGQDAGRRTLTSRMLGEEGQWRQVMAARYRRE